MASIDDNIPHSQGHFTCQSCSHKDPVQTEYKWDGTEVRDCKELFCKKILI